MTHGVIANTNLPAGKAEFNLEEAADVLGISSEELKSLVVARLEGEGQTQDLRRLKFRPADLIMLRMVRSAETH